MKICWIDARKIDKKKCWKKNLPENAEKTRVPLRNTLRTPLTSPTDVLSIEIQSIVGCGVPVAEQSNHPPDEFEKSNRDGGSITKLGPLKCDSYISA